MKNSHQNRRNFIRTSALATAGFAIVPSRAVSGLGHIAPSDKLNIAGIGVGGKGRTNLNNMVGQNIVALCDVDWDYASGVFKAYPGAKQWKDFREMLDKQKDIEAVVIATPDHTHAIQAMAAMQLGKHVYVQKPLTHSVWEARQLTEAARRYRVATQMGNEGHSRDEVRTVAEMIWSGVIGDVTRVYVTTDRPIWPQGLERPAGQQEIPAYLDWDLFLGPAPWRPFHESYHPWSWRAWWDFGTGALGDMGCHVMDVPFYALSLMYPVKVQASSTVVNTESAPQASRVEYTFPARTGHRNISFPEMKLIWTDGGIMPSRPDELPAGMSMGASGGINLFVGTRGKILCDSYGGNCKVLPANLNWKKPDGMVKRVPPHALGGGLHEMDWVRACKESPDSREEAASHFGYAGPLTETVVMGNLAIRLQALNRELEWDGQKMQVTNISDNEKINLVTSHQYRTVNRKPSFRTNHEETSALEFCNSMIRRKYRDGWGW